MAKELVEAGEGREAFKLSQRAPVRLDRIIKLDYKEGTMTMINTFSNSHKTKS